MKRLLLTAAIVAGTYFTSSAQCTPDLLITEPGIYPDTVTNLPIGTAGTFYSTDIQVRVFTDTVNGGVSVDVLDITLDSITGLPAGFTASPTPSSGAFPGGGNGCIRLSGTNAVAGIYPITVHVTLHGMVFGVVPIAQASIVAGYKIELQPAAVPVADFTQDLVSICEDGVVQFTDLSTGSPTSWEWIIPGAVPPTTTVQSPLVQFNSPGLYDVTLIVSNASGSDTLTQTALIEVKAKPFAQITPGVSNPIGICPNDSIQLFANQGAGLTYEWYFYGTMIGTAQNIWANKAGTYKVKVTDNATGCTKRSGLRFVESYPTPFVFVFPPAANTICLGDSMLLETVNNPGYQYQWYRGSNPVNNADSYQFYAKKNGYYRVEITSADGCKKKSGKFDLPITVNCRIAGESDMADGEIRLYPNPTAGNVQIDLRLPEAGQVLISVYDITGKLVESLLPVDLDSGAHTLSFDASGLMKGIYFVRIKGDNWERSSKLVVDR